MLVVCVPVLKVGGVSCEVSVVFIRSGEASSGENKW